MSEDKYMVFEKYGDITEWDQQSVRLLLEKAKAYLKSVHNHNSDKSYCTLMEIEVD
jgi:hypothetical protein